MKLPFATGLLSRRHSGRIAAGCRAAARALREGMAGTESDFLAVGGKLEAIVAHARSAAAAIDGPLGTLGGAGGEAMAGALDEVESWARSLGEGGTRAGELRNLDPVVAAVREPLGQLRGAARMLRVTGIVTRVESARLGGAAAGFLALADDVAGLAADIEQKSAQVQTAVDELRGLLADAGKNVAATEGRQHHDLIRLLEACRAGLGDLDGEQERVRAVSSQARAEYGRIVEEVGRIVVALQFHDSTRQRLEHAGEALIGLAERLDAGGGTGGAATLVRLQSAQIGEARRTFVETVGGIRRDLEAVQSASAELVRTAGELGNGDSGTKAAQHVWAAVSSIGDWIETRRALAAAANEVAAGCARTSEYVDEIRDLGIRLLRLALNAEVEAVRLADSGAVMEAVAEGIRGVSQEASRQAEEAGRALSAAETAVAGFTGGLDGGGAETARARQAEARLQQVCAELDARTDGAQQLLSAMSGQGAALSREIAALAAGLTADEQMERACAAGLEPLGEAVRLAGDGVPDGGGGSERALASVAELYTMQHEREIHAAVAGAALPEAGAALDGESGLSGNVELF